MSSSSSASSSSYIPYPSSLFSIAPAVTTEEFHAFHKMDRALFSRLVFGLKRDVNQSYEVFAFFYLVEQAGYVRYLIAFLLTLPDATINALAKEAIICLNFLYNKDYSDNLLVANSNRDGPSLIPLISRVTGGRLELLVIHQHREIVLDGMKTILDNVCIRAFEDIRVRAENHNKEQMLALERATILEDMKRKFGSTSRGN